MGNNPGKRGKPAPWTIRENEDRQLALHAYKIEQHSGYADHTRRRAAAFTAFRDGADFAAIKLSNKKLRSWDRENPSPMTWEEDQQLKAEFDATHIVIDRS